MKSGEKTAAILILLLLIFRGNVAVADDSNAPIDIKNYTPPVKLSCIGDSITAGYSDKKAYPLQLQELLGSDWKVSNFGVGGTTLLNHGDKPYQKEGAFSNALKSHPDVVVIMLGTNDSKPQNWKLKGEFVADYKNLIDQFKALESHPRIFICLPVPVTAANAFAIDESGVRDEIPMIKSIAEEENVGLIDLHSALRGHDALFPDHVHPNDPGAHLMAKAVFKALMGQDYTEPPSADEGK